MPKNINEIISHIYRNPLLKGYLYEVRIYGIDPNSNASEEIMLNCSQVNTPGQNIIFAGFKKWTIGNIHSVPQGKSYTELTLSFYQSEGDKERQYFHDWQQRIFNQDTLRFGYYKDYVKTISIIQYDKKRNKTYECRVHEAFPSNISPMDKGYTSEGVSQFNVNFQFYKVEELFFDRKLGFNPFG